jgi:sugar/nucleoside kinase (ribokinase family)
MSDDHTTPLSFQIVGDAFVDMLCFLQSSWPEKGGDAYLSQAISSAAGGSAVNTATHLTHLCRQLGQSLKGSQVDLHTVLNPTDHLGKLQQVHAKTHGYTLVNCLQHASPDEAGATGHCLVVVAEGERSFMSFRGCMKDFEASHVDFTKIAECESDVHLHVAGFYNLIGFFDGKLKRELEHFLALRKERYSQFQTFVSLVPQHDATGEWDGGIKDIIPLLDIFILNQLEATAISGIQVSGDDADSQIASRFATWFGTFNPTLCVVVTLGPRGAFACRNGVVFANVQAPKVDPLDPTGAGDNFAAGFLHGLWGWQRSHEQKEKIVSWPDEAIRAAIRWGCAVGTASVLVRGASVPSTPEAILKMYDQTLVSHE